MTSSLQSYPKLSLVISPCVYNKPHSRLLICCIPVAEPSGSASLLFPQDLDRSTLPPEFEKEGSDWFATFNPKAKRVLGISLVHTLAHDRLVALFIRSPITGTTGLTMFSPRLVVFSVFDSPRMENTWRRDARRQPRSTIRKLAPSLVRSFLNVCWPMGPLALTPSLLRSVFVDENPNGLYILSVCFSPDGKLLATANEDGVVRVSSRTSLSPSSSFPSRMLIGRFLAL